MTKTADKPVDQIQLVYVGECTIKKDGKDLAGSEWFDPYTKEYSYYSAKAAKGFRPGAIVEFDLQGPTTITVPGRFSGFYSDKTAVQEWQAKAEARTEAKRLEKAKKLNVSAEALEGMRRAYWNLSNRKQRAMLLANLISYVTAPFAGGKDH